MRRITILASTLPLLLAAILAGGQRSSSPCIAAGDTTVQIAARPWQATSHVSFTDDPARATVRVQIVDSADAADFAVIDDVETAEPGACTVTPATRLIGIAGSPGGSEPVIFLSTATDGDYRVYVASRSFTPRDAAALIVAARGSPRTRMATAALQLAGQGRD